MLDTTDSQVLSILATDGRISWSDLAHEIGLSAPAAAERARKLEQRGIIRGFAAVVDAGEMGCPLVAFVSVTLGRERDRRDFVERMRAVPEVLECHHVAGEDDYMLKLRCRDTADLERVLTAHVKTGTATKTRVTIALSTAKETSLPPPLASFDASARRRKTRRRTG